MSSMDLAGVAWRKSTRSGADGGTNCVEVAALADGRVAVRNSNAPEAGALFFTRAEMAAWIGGVQDHEFDDVGTPLP
jgi:hypothetical protein